MASHLHGEECEMGREPQGKGQGEDREDLADRPTQPAGDTTPGSTQAPRIPTDSATVSRLHSEECEDIRESQEEGEPTAGEETIEETIEGAAKEPLEEKCEDEESESIPEDSLGITVERDN
eukprot:9268797-Pyramimonas_sp.AAC.1